MISPTDVRTGFLPVFRSGSCAEIGPKSYMEDEHVCVDNLIEHLEGRAAGIPAPGAFYGVSSRWHVRFHSRKYGGGGVNVYLMFVFCS